MSADANVIPPCSTSWQQSPISLNWICGPLQGGEKTGKKEGKMKRRKGTGEPPPRNKLLVMAMLCTVQFGGGST